MAKKKKTIKKRLKWETHTGGPGIQREIVKNVKNESTHCRTWIMASKLKNVENETQTLYDLEYGKTTGKHGK